MHNEEEKKEVKHTLFGGAIGYDSPSVYENFLKNLDKAQSLHILITAVNFAQSKGVYYIQEAELLASCIRTFVVNLETEVKEP